MPALFITIVLMAQSGVLKRTFLFLSMISAISAIVLSGTKGALLGLIIVATLIGILESIMARLRLLRVPQLLAGAGTIAIIALILILRTR